MIIGINAIVTRHSGEATVLFGLTPRLVEPVLVQPKWDKKGEKSLAVPTFSVVDSKQKGVIDDGEEKTMVSTGEAEDPKRRSTEWHLDIGGLPPTWDQHKPLL